MLRHPTESSATLSLPPQLCHCRAKLLVIHCICSEHQVLAICLLFFHSSLLQFLFTAKRLLYEKCLATAQNFKTVPEILLPLQVSEDGINISLISDIFTFGKGTTRQITSVFIGKWQHLSSSSIERFPRQQFTAVVWLRALCYLHQSSPWLGLTSTFKIPAFSQATECSHCIVGTRGQKMCLEISKMSVIFILVTWQVLVHFSLAPECYYSDKYLLHSLSTLIPNVSK